jgi:hypothetical protein
MTLVWRPGFQFDADASTYIEAVEAADTQALETGVRYAINDFVIGCKNDGIWDAIKACCILAGARTLAGALVPLVGTAPTNYNFVAGDYNRETGLKGDGSTKYLDSNRAGNDDPQNNAHLAVFATLAPTNDAALAGSFGTTGTQITLAPAGSAFARLNTFTSVDVGSLFSGLGLCGVQRSSSSQFTARGSKNSVLYSAISGSPSELDLYIFARNLVGNYAYTNARLAFYSIGESLDLARLDARVTDLINAIGAAIP